MKAERGYSGPPRSDLEAHLPTPSLPWLITRFRLHDCLVRMQTVLPLATGTDEVPMTEAPCRLFRVIVRVTSGGVGIPLARRVL